MLIVEQVVRVTSVTTKPGWCMGRWPWIEAGNTRILLSRNTIRAQMRRASKPSCMPVRTYSRHVISSVLIFRSEQTWDVTGEHTYNAASHLVSRYSKTRSATTEVIAVFSFGLLCNHQPWRSADQESIGQLLSLFARPQWQANRGSKERKEKHWKYDI